MSYAENMIDGIYEDASHASISLQELISIITFDELIDDDNASSFQKTEQQRYTDLCCLINYLVTELRDFEIKQSIETQANSFEYKTLSYQDFCSKIRETKLDDFNATISFYLKIINKGTVPKKPLPMKIHQIFTHY